MRKVLPSMIKHSHLANVFRNEILLFLFLSFSICSCHPFQKEPITQGQDVGTHEITPFLPKAQSTATNVPLNLTTVIPQLPEVLRELKIDGQKVTAEFSPQLNTWIWKDKKGSIRRLLDPLSGHLLVRTAIPKDHLAFEIDYAFKWEVNLVNYDIYPTHAPFGSAYIKLLKNKYPEILSQTNDHTGIVFRILLLKANELPKNTPMVTLLDVGTQRERFFLPPFYLSGSNEYVFSMGLTTDFLNRKGAINTYTEEMLNYCLSPVPVENPSGVWGIEVYKHTIK